MNATERQLRGAVFGGFNRQDVMRYIESVTRENSARISALEKELEETKEKNAVMARELAGFHVESAGSEEKLIHLSSDLEKSAAVLTKQTEALSYAERELALLRKRVRQMEEAAAAYENLKELAGTIELDARNRAQQIIQEAEAISQKTRDEMERWLDGIQGRYFRLRRDVDAMLTHAGSEMERTKTVVDQMIGSFAEQDDDLRNIIKMYQEEAGKAFCAPSPASEKVEVGVR